MLGKSNAKAKTGHWTRQTHLFAADAYICSQCGKSVQRPFKVCPYCKARMSSTSYDPSWVDEAETLSALLDDD